MGHPVAVACIVMEFGDTGNTMVGVNNLVMLGGNDKNLLEKLSRGYG